MTDDGPGYRSVQRSRLVYYRNNATAPEFWARRWEDHAAYRTLPRYRSGDLSHYRHVFGRWLPKTGHILEAGCGAGHMVLALQSRGYSVIGFDFSVETLKRAKTVAPELRTVAGDIFNLGCPDSTFSALVSLGVVEHYVEGPTKALEESKRVLKDGGLLFCTVPFYSPYRRLKAGLGAYGSHPRPDLDFYQYAFSSLEFSQIVESAGFEVLDIEYQNPAKGLQDEVAWFAKLWSGSSLVQKLLSPKLPLARILVPWFAHKLTVVARKPNSAANSSASNGNPN